MNKTYRNVWCAKTGTFIAAAETARAKGKSARGGLRALSCAALLSLGGLADAAYAGAMDGGSTVGGVAADIAYGNGANTTNAAGGKAAVAIGQNASANNLSGATPNANGTVAVGDSANATDGGVAVGGASYAASMATAIGAGATAATANSVALGANSVANSTTLGTAGFAPVGGTAIAGATAAGEVSVGKAGAERRITNVAAGLNSTDAVNVSQLMAEDAKVNNISSNLSNVINGGGIKYFHSNSTLLDSTASGMNSVAIGGAAAAMSTASIALGSNSLAMGANSVAIGPAASTAYYADIAIGMGAQTLTVPTLTPGQVAIGYNATAYGTNGISQGPNTALGTSTVAGRADSSVSQATAVGFRAAATNWEATALGYNATASGVYSDAFGDSSRATGDYGTTVGGYSQATASGATALGFNSLASGVNSIALGNNAKATTASSVALGANSLANSTTLGSSGFAPVGGTAISAATAAGEVSVGAASAERRITNVAAGLNPTDAVNVSQLKSEDAKVAAQGAATAAALGGGSSYNATTGSITNPTYVVGGSTINNIGGAITNIDARTTQNTNAITNIDARTTQIAGDVTNLDARTTQMSSDITNLTTSINNGELGLVKQDATTRNITVAANTDGSIVNFSGTAGARKLTGVLAGNVSASSVDAVNGSQLFNVANSTASAIGGGSTVNSDGSISVPSYVIGGTTVNNIAGAVTNIDARTTQNTNAITNIDARTTQIAGDVTNLDARTTQMSSEITNLTTSITNGELGLVKQDATTRNITVAANTDGSIVDFSGTAGARKLTGVLAGNVSASSVDAVNGSQLFNVANSTASAIGGGSTVNSDGSISVPSYVIGGTTVNNIAGAVTNIDARTTQIAGEVTNLDARTTQMSSDITNLTTSITNGEFGLVQQDATTRNITVAANTDGSIVDFSGTAGARKLTGVLAGNVSASSVDAVNGSQLFNVSNSMASAVGGGSTVNSDGSISKPSYVIGGTTVNNIAGAITNIDARTTQLANDVTNLTTSISNGGLGLVEQDATTRNITVAKGTDGSIVDFTGTAGARKLTGVLAGDVNASSVDAVNGSQLYSLANSTATAIGGGSTVNIDGSISVPSYVIGGATVNSIGGAITNIDARTTQNAAEISSINTALTNITAGGVSSKYFHTNSTRVDSQATGSESVAIGGAAVATSDNSVALGANSIADRANSVSIGSMGAERQITNVAAGTADTDAVNVAQMNSALASVANMAANAGTGSPTFAANGDGDTAPAKATGHHATAMGSNSQASADNSVAIGADSVADRENTVSIGTKGKERQITNVAAGTQGTDAVNVDQLNETVAGAVGNLPAGVSAKDYTDQRINSMQNSVNQVAKNAYAGVAAAMAMPNMTPSKPGNTVVAGGAGSYKSGAALGVGATYRSRDSKWLVNGAVSVTSTGDAGVRAQVGYEF